MARVMTARASNVQHSLATSFRGIFDTIRHEHNREQGQKKPIQIGVCVSGGADSMALAYLLKQASEIPAQIKVVLLALLVNHNVREGSVEEATSVKAQLEKLGIKSKILHMYWSRSEQPASLPDFETQARRIRYRMIANEAIDKKIHHLFLGHHQDDQIETILMRLIRNSSDSFLGRQGIPANSTIPCCEDKRSAQTVERYERFGDWLRHVRGFHLNADQWESTELNHGKAVTPSRAGGIQIHRPLLQFTKAEILQFCGQHDIVYVNDKTNFDPTLTLRNAVRYLRTNYMLPNALQGSSILELHKGAKNCLESLTVRGEIILRLVRVDVFDLRSGRLTVRLPPQFNGFCEADPEGAAYALARLTSLVSPCPQDDGATLVPQHGLEDFLLKNRQSGRGQMTMQQALLEKADPIATIEKPSTSDVRKISATVDSDGTALSGRETVWTLSRPPMRANELEAASLSFRPWRWEYSHPNRLKVAPHENKDCGLWSRWMLWDHRYWIRVRTKSARQLRKIGIRTYAEADVQNVHKRLGDESDDLQKMLALAAPGKSRFTIPVLTVDGNVSIFPTLNVMVQKPGPRKLKSIPNQHPILEWEVCYKILDQPLIKNQVSTIDWKNAQVKHPSQTDDHSQHLANAPINVGGGDVSNNER